MRFLCAVFVSSLLLKRKKSKTKGCCIAACWFSINGKSLWSSSFWFVVYYCVWCGIYMNIKKQTNDTSTRISIGNSFVQISKTFFITMNRKFFWQIGISCLKLSRIYDNWSKIVCYVRKTINQFGNPTEKKTVFQLKSLYVILRKDKKLYLPEEGEKKEKKQKNNRAQHNNWSGKKVKFQAWPSRFFFSVRVKSHQFNSLLHACRIR